MIYNKEPQYLQRCCTGMDQTVMAFERETARNLLLNLKGRREGPYLHMCMQYTGRQARVIFVYCEEYPAAPLSSLSNS